MTTDLPGSATYLIDSSDEMQRLDRQAGIYGSADDLAHLALWPTDRVLDAGCGSGRITRSIAAALPQGQVTGVDREPRYLAHARQQAQGDGLQNIRFVEGNLLALPFEAGSFDVVWSKHVLQWVDRPDAALREMVRVTRPGGRVIACNFTDFLTRHHPEDPAVQADMQRWVDAARAMIGFDNMIGHKLPRLFIDAGLTDIHIDSMPDKAYSGLGGSSERLWNMQVQWRAAQAFALKVWGSQAAADAAGRRILDCCADPTVYFHCTLFYVEGRVPG
jgi:ubiquinone/menaquinone biosynthesis C-methylase UbiE